jgi:hypothetical protein
MPLTDKQADMVEVKSPATEPIDATNPALTERHLGMTFGFFARNGYFASDQARRQPAAMAELGIRWVCLCVNVMSESFASTRQFRDFTYTPADDEVLSMIQLLREHGLKVQLRPMLNSFDGTMRIHVHLPVESCGFPGMNNNYVEDWFAGMTARATHYARLAQEGGADLYCLDSELDQLAPKRFNDQWKRVIGQCRSVYDGPITIGTNPKDMLELVSDRDHWFHDLDMLGVSYYPYADVPDGASVEQIMAAHEPVRDMWRQIAEAYGKPFLFHEAGCTSSQGAARRPWQLGSPAYAPQEQANWMDAVFGLYSAEPWWRGLYWWKWDEQNDRPEFTTDPAGDQGFTIAGKPAAHVMKRWRDRLSPDERLWQ